jgi:hypothetical protein
MGQRAQEKGTMPETMSEPGLQPGEVARSHCGFLLRYLVVIRRLAATGCPVWSNSWLVVIQEMSGRGAAVVGQVRVAERHHRGGMTSSRAISSGSRKRTRMLQAFGCIIVTVGSVRTLP